MSDYYFLKIHRARRDELIAEAEADRLAAEFSGGQPARTFLRELWGRLSAPRRAGGAAARPARVTARPHLNA